MKTETQIIEELNKFFQMIPAEEVAKDLRLIATMANRSEEIKMHDRLRVSELNFTQHQTGKLLQKLQSICENLSKPTVNLPEITLN